MLQRRYGGQLDERADTYIGFAVDGAKRMQDLINDLLAFSRVGRVSEPEVVVDTRELVDRAASALGNAIEASGATLEVGALPRVRGEASLLALVFQNLIGNGIKFRGDAPPRIRVGAERTDGEWCFTIADNGIGIEPEYADRIFIIFQRLHPRATYEGTGIGLAMVRKIVEYHGGRVWLDTERNGAGATFHFTLPAIDEEAEEAPAAP
jgi:light-regulated signal transduction histidine kinase (bacteriophytochrome)